MPEPLDYESRDRRDETSTAKSRDQTPSSPVPIEFDCLLTRTQDRAGASAVEKQVLSQGLSIYRVEDRLDQSHWIELHVRSADYERASLIAASVFARRAKVKSIPRQVLSPDSMPGDPER